jgi:hypothetical protein
MPVYHRVKVYTWNGLLALRDIDKIKSYIALAYTTALVEEPTPTKLHIRCVLTPTTKMPLLIKYCDLYKIWDSPPLSKKWGYKIRYDSSTAWVSTYSP